MILLTSPGIARIPFLDRMLRSPVGLWPGNYELGAVAGWGMKPSGRLAEKLARRLGVPCLRLEDGFLRSFRPGPDSPPLSIVVDELGIYYDCTRASGLESLLNSDADLLADMAGEVARAKALILEHRLSKYNHAPDWKDTAGCVAEAKPSGARAVLVVDQTLGDLSVRLGAAGPETFAAMLNAALAENPDAIVYVKTHPEAVSGRKAGYLTQVADDARTVVLRQAINPLSLIGQVDRVYVVSSTMGFEALLAGKPVTCFGLPWYAGWGATDDRQPCPRRQRRRSVDELFAAAYFQYTRYLDPLTRQPGTIFDVIDWLLRQRRLALNPRGRTVRVGFSAARMSIVRPFLNALPTRQIALRRVDQAAGLRLGAEDRLPWWGREVPESVTRLASQTGARVVRLEDGFVRSVGLGTDLIKPLSLVLDRRGLYFDPSQESDLEHILNHATFSNDELERARWVRDFMVRHGITKYNLEPRRSLDLAAAGRMVVFVPGQVENDASIRFGCEQVRTNLGLLRAARLAHPDAFIVYKPHPDVLANNRGGGVRLGEAALVADHIEVRSSVISCIEAADVVHSMTSLSGFDALLRGKRVVVHGRPFYAGWGLTEDRLSMPRRQRRLSLDELVAATLLRYPLYWDWALQGFTECEAVLRQILERRDALERTGELERLRTGSLRRQARKLGLWARAWLDGRT